ALVYEIFEGKLLNSTKHVRIPRIFCWIDIKSVTVNNTNKLLAEVYPYEVVSIFLSKEERLLLLSEVYPYEVASIFLRKEERLLLLSEVGPSSQQYLEDEVDDDEKNGMDGGKNLEKEEESLLGDSEGEDSSVGEGDIEEEGHDDSERGDEEEGEEKEEMNNALEKEEEERQEEEKVEEKEEERQEHIEEQKDEEELFNGGEVVGHRVEEVVAFTLVHGACQSLQEEFGGSLDPATTAEAIKRQTTRGKRTKRQSWRITSKKRGVKKVEKVSPISVPSLPLGKKPVKKLTMVSKGMLRVSGMELLSIEVQELVQRFFSTCDLE
ncbi:hypothetical protein Droror1_Dr00026671, partial [Drosera rotundifolia]